MRINLLLLSFLISTICLAQNTFEAPVEGQLTITECDGILYDSGGENGEYEAHTNAIVQIQGSSGDYLEVTFTQFETEFNFDYVLLFAGDSTNAEFIGAYSGNELPNDGQPIQISGLDLTLFFQTDGLINGAGFAMEFSCKENVDPPTADATFSSFTCSGIVNFSDASTGFPDTWEWDFGDGNTSTEQNPTHLYSAPGTYDVQLITCNANGCDTLFQENAIDYDPDDFICNNGFNIPEIGLETSEECNGILFDSGGPDGDYTSNNHGQFLIAPPGATSIALTFTEFNLGNLGEHTDMLYIYDGETFATLGIYLGSDLPNGGQTLTFDVSSIYVIFTTDSANEFSGFTMLWEANGSSEAPVADFSASAIDVAFGEPVQFTDQSLNGPGIWEWDFGDGNTSTEQNPIHSYIQAGTFEVTFIATNCNGSDTTGNFFITVQDAPAITITPDSINLTLNAGESDTRLITICNTGGGDLLLDMETVGIGSGVGYLLGFQTNENGADFTWALMDTDFNVLQQNQQAYGPNQLYQEALFGLNPGEEYYLGLFSPEGVQALESFIWYDQSTGGVFFEGFLETGPNAIYILPTPFVPGDPNAGIPVDWLSTNTGSEVLISEECEDYTVNIDASELNAGVYNGEIRIDSNDPNQGNSVVPVTLTVIGTPAITVDPNILDFGEVQVGATASLDFTIENTGTDNLTVSGLTSTDAAFSINSTDALELAPGQSQIITADFSPTASTSFSTTLSIANNAGNDIQVTLQGNGTPAPSLTIDPTSFTLELVEGEDSTLIVNLGNIGEAELDFTASSTSDGTGFDFSFTTDFWPSEFSWTLTDAQGNIVESSNGSIYEANTAYTIALTGLSSSEFYTLNMFDSFGDGGVSEYSVQDRATGQLVIEGTFTDGFDELVDLGSPTEGSSIVSPSQGSVVINGNQELSIEITTDGLSTGVYEYTVTVVTNDPAQPTVDVDITLFVIAPVTADFSAQEVVCGDAIPVQFTDLSSNVPTSWTWDFGDGTTSTEQNPVHTYATSGTYTVTLTACNSLGCDEIVRTDFIAVDTDCFTQNIPTNHGVETITVCEGTVYDSGGPDGNYVEGNFSRLVIAPPGAESVSITFSEFNFDHGDFLYIFDGLYGSGNIIGTYTGNELAGQTIVANSGVLTLIEYTDHFINLSGFAASFSCDVDPVAPVADFNFFIDSVLCINEPAIFIDQSAPAADQWAWDFGDGFTSNEQNPIHQYTASGTYNVSLTACNSIGCDTYIETIEVNVDIDCIIDQIPGDGGSNVSVITSCSGVLYDSGGPDENYLNNNIGVVTIYQENVSVSFFEFDYAEGDYVAIYDGIDTNAPLIGFYTGNEIPEGGNTIVASGLGITILEFSDGASNGSGFLMGYACPNANFEGGDNEFILVNNIEICDGIRQFSTPDTMQVDSWIWNFGDNTTSTEASPEHEFPHEGMFEVSLEACYEGDCETYAIMVYSNKLSPEIVAPDEAVVGEEVQFEGMTESATHWNWDFGNGEVSTHNMPTVIYEEPGDYDVHVHLINMNVHETCDANHTHTINIRSETTTNTTDLVNQKISVYPNPASDFIQVDFSATTIMDFEVQLFNVNGQLVKTVINQNTLDTSDLMSGTYILQVVQENANPAQFKVMIQR